MMSSKGITPVTLLCAGLLVSGCAQQSLFEPVSTAVPTVVWDTAPVQSAPSQVVWIPTPPPLATVVASPAPVRPAVAVVSQPAAPEYEEARLFTVQPPASTAVPARSAVTAPPAAPTTRRAARRIDSAPAVVQRPAPKVPEVRVAKAKPAVSPRKDAQELTVVDKKIEKASRTERVETPKPGRGFFGSFVTRKEPAATAAKPVKPESSAKPESPVKVARLAKPSAASGEKKAAEKRVPQTFAEWHVAKAPVPEGKPYILRAAPVPASKPSRAEAPLERDFAVGTATLMAAANIPDLPANIPTRTQPIRLNDRSFATPGKPSALGTDQDTVIDIVAIGAAPYGVGAAADVSKEGADVKWPSAVRLIEAGEVQGLSILDEESLLLTLCTGRSVMTAPPDLSSVTTVVAPEIICGRRSRLAIQ